MSNAKKLKEAANEIADILEYYGIETKFTDYGLILELEEAEIELNSDYDVIRTLRGED